MAPAAVGAAIVAATTIPNAFASGDNPSLPVLSAADLLTAVRTSDVQALSGTVRVNSALGLPALPNRFAAAGGPAALLTGSHTMRVWADGPERQRVALLGDLAENDFVHNGADVWTYDSSHHAATHYVLPRQHGAPPRPDEGTANSANPADAGRHLLDGLDPSTTTSVTGTGRVAGRPAYELTVVPRTADSLISRVRIAIDSATHVPLRLEIYAIGHSAPAWSTGFTDVSFRTPAASVFRFSPPAGAAVADHSVTDQAGPGERAGSSGRNATAPRTIGTGWATVIELPAGSAAAASGTSGRERSGNPLEWLIRASTPVPEGRLLTTRLASVLITPDGRIFVGAVPPAVVRAAAAAR